MTADTSDAGLSVLTQMPATKSLPVSRLDIAGFLDSADVVIALRIARLVSEPLDSLGTLALALALNRVRDGGSTALDLTRVPTMRPRVGLESDSAEDAGSGTPDSPGTGTEDDPTAAITPTETAMTEIIDLPEPQEWYEELTRSRLVAAGVLRLDLDLVYLDRYHADETLIAERLVARDGAAPAPLASQPPAEAAATPEQPGLDPAQQAAVDSVLTRPTTVLTGGPGMGKTHTIASVLAAVRAADPQARIALAAPTGKAAARMSESLREQNALGDENAVTLHRLLGSVWGSSQRFRHDARNPLPHDLVVVDEASMVSLSMTARLLEALPVTARLLLVGDPDQLASVEAGSVLGDLVTGLGPQRGVIRLTRDHRLDAGRVELAQAFRDGDPDAVLAAMDNPDAGVTFIESETPDASHLDGVHAHARALRHAAMSGDADAAIAELGRARLLCAHRSGVVGTRRWNRLVEQGLAEVAPEVAYQEMYVGRPLLVTRNDYGLGLANGDTGVIVLRDGEPLAVVETATGTKEFSPWRLADIETMHAMTVHKAQGSQADHVTVLVPPLDSRLLTREMLYTAVTRARRSLTIVGTREAVRQAVLSPVQRSSGLARRLAEASPPPQWPADGAEA